MLTILLPLSLFLGKQAAKAGGTDKQYCTYSAVELQYIVAKLFITCELTINST